MTVTALPIGNGTYESSSLPLSAQQCINWYRNVPEVPTLAQESLLGTPGIVQLATSGAFQGDQNRGAWVLDDVPYFVNGNSLYRLESDKTTLTNVGTITGSGAVWMSDNGVQLCILVPGTTSTGYIFTSDPDSLVTISDLDFKANGEPQAVVYVDGYFVFTTSTRKFIISAISDGASYNALDFGSAEADPDAIIAPVVVRNQLFIAGTETIEAFQNIGGADFPFQRTGLFISKGVRAAASLISSNDTFMFIGGGKGEAPAVWELSGNGVRKVSTIAIDNIIQKLSPRDLVNVKAWYYSQAGAFFTGFSLLSTTIVYDAVTERWHERKSQLSDGRGTLIFTALRVASVVPAYGSILVGDTQDGRIGEFDLNVFKEYESNIVRTVSTQPFQNNMLSLSVAWIELTVESGVGNVNAIDPSIRMDRSLDGGKTWGYDRGRRIGKVGDYKHRAIWRRIGRVPRFVVFRFTLSDPVKPAILQLTADLVGGQ